MYPLLGSDPAQIHELRILHTHRQGDVEAEGDVGRLSVAGKRDSGWGDKKDFDADTAQATPAPVVGMQDKERVVHRLITS